MKRAQACELLDTGPDKTHQSNPADLGGPTPTNLCISTPTEDPRPTDLRSMAKVVVPGHVVCRRGMTSLQPDGTKKWIALLV